MIKKILLVFFSLYMFGCGVEQGSNPRSIVLYSFSKYDTVSNAFMPYSAFIWNLQLYYGFSLYKDSCPQAFFSSNDFALPTDLNIEKSIFGSKTYFDSCFPQNVELKVTFYDEDTVNLYYQVEYDGELYRFRREK